HEEAFADAEGAVERALDADGGAAERDVGEAAVQAARGERAGVAIGATGGVEIDGDFFCGSERDAEVGAPLAGFELAGPFERHADDAFVAVERDDEFWLLHGG